MSEDSSAFVALSSRRECKITRDYIGFSLVKGRLPYSCKKKILIHMVKEKKRTEESIILKHKYKTFAISLTVRFPL